MLLLFTARASTFDDEILDLIYGLKDFVVPGAVREACWTVRLAEEALIAIGLHEIFVRTKWGIVKRPVARSH